MATQLQDLQAKRKELQATNPNATMLDAKSALSPIAPIAWVAPAITPLPTETPAPIDNKQVLENNQAKVQSEIANGTRPAVWTQATPAQVPEIVQQNQPPVIQAEQDLNKKYGWVIQGNWLNSVQPLPETPLTMPASPVSEAKAPTTKSETPQVVAPPTTRQIATQQNFNKYNSMSSQQFVDLMKQWAIPSEISGQLTQTNPQFQQAQQEYSKFLKTNNINSWYKAVYNGLTGKETAPQTNPLEEISNKFMKLLWADANDMTYVEAFKNSLTNNDTLRTKTQELNAKQAEINEKTKARDDLLKQYKLTYKDTPLAILVAMASQDAQPINEEIATLQSERDQLKADVTYETELAKWEYDAQVKDMETKTWIRNSILSNLMNQEFTNAQNDKNYQQSIALKQMDYEQQQNTPSFQQIWDKVYKVQNGVMTDTWIAAEKWASFQVIWDKVYKVKWDSITEVPWISTLSETKANLPEWKVIWKNPDWTDKYGFVNSATRTVSPYWETSSTPVIPPTPDAIKSISERLQWDNVQCGMVSNDYASQVFPQMTRMWDSYESKVDAVKSIWVSETPQVWWVFAMKIMGSKTWHTWIVQSISADGKYVTVTDANKSGSANGWPVTTSTYPVTSNMTFSKWPQTQGSPVPWQYTDEQVNNLAYLVELQEKNPSEASKQMKELGYKAQDMANFKAWNVPLTEKQKNSSTDVMTAIADLADPSKYEWNDAVWFLAWTPSLSGWDAATATMAIDNLVAKMTLPNLWVLKWPMSDKDIAFIQSASSKLSRNQSDASFENNLIDAYNLAARRAWLPEIESLADINTPTKKTSEWKPAYSKYE